MIASRGAHSNQKIEFSKNLQENLGHLIGGGGALVASTLLIAVSQLPNEFIVLVSLLEERDGPHENLDKMIGRRRFVSSPFFVSNFTIKFLSNKILTAMSLALCILIGKEILGWQNGLIGMLVFSLPEDAPQLQKSSASTHQLQSGRRPQSGAFLNSRGTILGIHVPSRLSVKANLFLALSTHFFLDGTGIDALGKGSNNRSITTEGRHTNGTQDFGYPRLN
ncbi:hypothetical protein Tco_0128175 [Tanacetum coccineum]